MLIKGRRSSIVVLDRARQEAVAVERRPAATHLARNVLSGAAVRAEERPRLGLLARAHEHKLRGRERGRRR